MLKSIVITLIGDDRPGIVESVSRIIVNYHGEWVESRLVNLSGKFAGVLRANIPQQECDAFTVALEEGTPGLSVSIEQAHAEEAAKGKCYKLELVGQDRPGIIHRISSALVKNGATVDEMESEVTDASMSGEKLFKANITLCLAKGYKIDDLSDELEELANELIVDIVIE